MVPVELTAHLPTSERCSQTKSLYSGKLLPSNLCMVFNFEEELLGVFFTIHVTKMKYNKK